MVRVRYRLFGLVGVLRRGGQIPRTHQVKKVCIATARAGTRWVYAELTGSEDTGYPRATISDMRR